jgi:ribosomal protein S27AE
MSEPDARIDVQCKNCGATFSAFLQHMADHNQKVVCPKCGQADSCSQPEIQNSLKAER